MRGVLLGLAAALAVLSGTAGVVQAGGSSVPGPLTEPRAVSAALPPPPLGHGAPASRGHGRRVPLGVDPAWAAGTAAAAGIPEPALLAYAGADLRLRREDPDCGLGWTTLAGIGHIESQHGTIGGRSLSSGGVPDRPVLGPALDGRGDVAAIPSDGDSVRWHGDPSWDHAVGPMQFIPSTWERWASDGDGDGIADPHDLDDAAYAAGRYLCADGHDLTTAQGWSDAVFAYNHAQVYVEAVHAAAIAYATRSR